MINQEKVWDSLYRKNLKWNLETDMPHICKGKIILELGAGNGKTLKAIIRQKPKKVYAMDFSEPAVDILRKEFPDVEIAKADLMSLPYKSGFFDMVICSFVLNNIMNRDKAVSEMMRVLKSKGKVYFQDFASGDYREESFDKEYSKEGRYCHFFTVNEVKELFSQFKTIEFKIREKQAIRTDVNKKRRTISGTFCKA